MSLSPIKMFLYILKSGEETALHNEAIFKLTKLTNYFFFIGYSSG